MVLLARPDDCNPFRIWSIGGEPANRTYTSVPPRKSIPYRRPPFFRIEAHPTASRTSDRVTKYFAFPIQSTFTPLKNSIESYPSLLDTVLPAIVPGFAFGPHTTKYLVPPAVPCAPSGNRKWLARRKSK